MHLDPPGAVHVGICISMIVVGVVLIAVGAIFGRIWGPLRLILVLAGIAVLIIGFLMLLSVKGLKIKVSASGIEVSADRDTGYTLTKTKTMTVSPSLTEGGMPPKRGSMPAKDGPMPGDVRPRSLGPSREGTAQDRPPSSGGP